jgi:hypothetical protein
MTDHFKRIDRNIDVAIAAVKAARVPGYLEERYLERLDAEMAKLDELFGLHGEDAFTEPLTHLPP